MTTKDIASFIASNAYQAVVTTTTVLPATTDQCTKAEAYRMYGRSIIDRWISEGLVTVIDKRISRKQLERLAARSNRQTYLPVAER